MNFMKRQSGSCCQRRDKKLSNFIKKIFICVPKMKDLVLNDMKVSN